MVNKIYLTWVKYWVEDLLVEQSSGRCGKLLHSKDISDEDRNELRKMINKFQLQ